MRQDPDPCLKQIEFLFDYFFNPLPPKAISSRRSGQPPIIMCLCLTNFLRTSKSTGKASVLFAVDYYLSSITQRCTILTSKYQTNTKSQNSLEKMISEEASPRPSWCTLHLQNPVQFTSHRGCFTRSESMWNRYGTVLPTVPASGV